MLAAGVFLRVAVNAVVALRHRRLFVRFGGFSLDAVRSIFRAVFDFCARLLRLIFEILRQRAAARRPVGIVLPMRKAQLRKEARQPT